MKEILSEIHKRKFESLKEKIESFREIERCILEEVLRKLEKRKLSEEIKRAKTNLPKIIRKKMKKEERVTIKRLEKGIKLKFQGVSLKELEEVFGEFRASVKRINLPIMAFEALLEVFGMKEVRGVVEVVIDRKRWGQVKEYLKLVYLTSNEELHYEEGAEEGIRTGI